MKIRLYEYDEFQEVVSLPSGIGDISRFLATLLRPFGFIAPKTLNYLSFQSFYIERHPETRRAH